MAKRDKCRPWVENPIQFMYPTSDNWHPNFPRNCVEVSVYLYFNPDNIAHSFRDKVIRISIGGADDTGMEIDYEPSPAEYEATLEWVRHFVLYELPNPLTKKWLLEHGFQSW